MDGPRIISSRLRSGVWEGRIGPVSGNDLPEVQAICQERTLDGLDLAWVDEPGQVSFRIALPADFLSDGPQTLVLSGPLGHRIGSLPLYAGEMLEADVRAEIDLLRAELDMLKRAFRRHCVETGADK